MDELAAGRIVEGSALEGVLTRDDLEGVLDRVGEGIAISAPDGRIVYANEAAARLLGLASPADVRGASMGEHRRRFEIFDIAGRPLDPRVLPGERARLGDEEGELLVRFRPVEGGDEHVALVRAVRILGSRGELRYVVSVFRTVTEEQAAESLRKLEQVTKSALAHLSLGDLVPALLDAIREVLGADTAAILLLDETERELMMRVTVGFAEEEVSQAIPVPLGQGLAGRVAASRDAWLVDDLEEIDLVSPVLRAHGVLSLIAVPLVVEDRVLGVAHVGSLEKQHFGSGDVRLFELIADRIAVALQQSRLLEAERAAQERLSFLGEASSLLASSLDYEDTLARIAELAVPRLADWCSVDIIAEDGSVRRLATTHVDPEKVRWAWELTRRFDPDDEGGVATVLRSGEPQFLPEIPRELLDAAVVRRPGLREILDQLGLSSGMIVPIGARGRTLGAISFIWAESGHRYTKADLEMALDLGRRAGIAVDNALLYREAEERAQASRVLASVGDGVVLVDSAGVIRYWNRAAEAITGLPRSAVDDRPAGEAIPGWDDVVRHVPVSLDPQAAPRAQSLPLGVGERELWLSVTGVSVVDGTVYAFRDLTEERALETLRAEFVSTVSHELRTPLAAIYGAAMTLRRDDIVLDEDQSTTLLNVMTSESDRLARTVNAILWASRLDTDALSTTIESCDPVRLARDVVDAHRTHLPGHVRLELEHEAGLPAVAADPDKVRQVLVNLVDNAVKYSPDGGEVRLAVSTEADRVRFAVHDEGLGIPYAEQRRIFDKFYRLDPDMTRGIGGTGLGLYICRELVRRMDGRIWVTSEPGSGSTFAFELPVAN
jgi:signal transduction histidine kinase/transcriptional regulator with GAF, ATPase, and Fis domain